METVEKCLDDAIENLYKGGQSSFTVIPISTVSIANANIENHSCISSNFMKYVSSTCCSAKNNAVKEVDPLLELLNRLMYIFEKIPVDSELSIVWTVGLSSADRFIDIFSHKAWKNISIPFPSLAVMDTTYLQWDGNITAALVYLRCMLATGTTFTCSKSQSQQEFSVLIGGIINPYDGLILQFHSIHKVSNERVSCMTIILLDEGITTQFYHHLAHQNSLASNNNININCTQNESKSCITDNQAQLSSSSPITTLLNSSSLLSKLLRFSTSITVTLTIVSKDICYLNSWATYSNSDVTMSNLMNAQALLPNSYMLNILNLPVLSTHHPYSPSQLSAAPTTAPAPIPLPPLTPNNFSILLHPQRIRSSGFRGYLKAVSGSKRVSIPRETSKPGRTSVDDERISGQLVFSRCCIPWRQTKQSPNSPTLAWWQWRRNSVINRPISHPSNGVAGGGISTDVMDHLAVSPTSVTELQFVHHPRAILSSKDTGSTGFFYLELVSTTTPLGSCVDSYVYRAVFGDNQIVNQGWDLNAPAALSLLLPDNVGEVCTITVLDRNRIYLSLVEPKSDSNPLPIWINGIKVDHMAVAMGRVQNLSSNDIIVIGSLRYCFKIQWQPNDIHDSRSLNIRNQNNSSIMNEWTEDVMIDCISTTSGFLTLLQVAHEIVRYDTSDRIISTSTDNSGAEDMEDAVESSGWSEQEESLAELIVREVVDWGRWMGCKAKVCWRQMSAVSFEEIDTFRKEIHFTFYVVVKDSSQSDRVYGTQPVQEEPELPEDTYKLMDIFCPDCDSLLLLLHACVTQGMRVMETLSDAWSDFDTRAANTKLLKTNRSGSSSTSSKSKNKTKTKRVSSRHKSKYVTSSMAHGDAFTSYPKGTFSASDLTLPTAYLSLGRAFYKAKETDGVDRIQWLKMTCFTILQHQLVEMDDRRGDNSYSNIFHSKFSEINQINDFQIVQLSTILDPYWTYHPDGNDYDDPEVAIAMSLLGIFALFLRKGIRAVCDTVSMRKGINGKCNKLTCVYSSEGPEQDMNDVLTFLFPIAATAKSRNKISLGTYLKGTSSKIIGGSTSDILSELRSVSSTSDNGTNASMSSINSRSRIVRFHHNVVGGLGPARKARLGIDHTDIDCVEDTQQDANNWFDALPRIGSGDSGTAAILLSQSPSSNLSDLPSSQTKLSSTLIDPHTTAATSLRSSETSFDTSKFYTQIVQQTSSGDSGRVSDTTSPLFGTFASFETKNSLVSNLEFPKLLANNVVLSKNRPQVTERNKRHYISGVNITPPAPPFDRLNSTSTSLRSGTSGSRSSSRLEEDEEVSAIRSTLTSLQSKVKHFDSRQHGPSPPPSQSTNTLTSSTSASMNPGDTARNCSALAYSCPSVLSPATPSLSQSGGSRRNLSDCQPFLSVLASIWVRKGKIRAFMRWCAFCASMKEAATVAEIEYNIANRDSTPESLKFRSRKGYETNPDMRTPIRKSYFDSYGMLVSPAETPVREEEDLFGTPALRMGRSAAKSPRMNGFNRPASLKSKMQQDGASVVGSPIEPIDSPGNLSSGIFSRTNPGSQHSPRSPVIQEYKSSNEEYFLEWPTLATTTADDQQVNLLAEEQRMTSKVSSYDEDTRSVSTLTCSMASMAGGDNERQIPIDFRLWPNAGGGIGNISNKEKENKPSISPNSTSSSPQRLTHVPPPQILPAQKFREIMPTHLEDNTSAIWTPEDMIESVAIAPNQMLFWHMFSHYSSKQSGRYSVLVPSEGVSPEKRYRKRLLTIESLWDMLRDFGVCPIHCNNLKLSNIAKALMDTEGNEESSLSSSALNVSMLNFLDFQRVLVRIVLECIQPTARHRNQGDEMQARAQTLIRLMEQSAGRDKMGRGSMSSHFQCGSLPSIDTPHPHISKHMISAVTHSSPKHPSMSRPSQTGIKSSPPSRAGKSQTLDSAGKDDASRSSQQQKNSNQNSPPVPPNKTRPFTMSATTTTAKLKLKQATL